MVAIKGTCCGRAFMVCLIIGQDTVEITPRLRYAFIRLLA